jgi:hypothetical protein
VGPLSFEKQIGLGRTLRMVHVVLAGAEFLPSRQLIGLDTFRRLDVFK